MDQPTFRSPSAADLPAMAALAAQCQPDPDRFCMYIGTDAESIAADVAEADRWTDSTVVAERDGELIGWLLAEVDPDMGRLWWWGPFATEALDPIGDQLYTEVRRCLDENFDVAFDEEEACADDRSVSIPAWCARHGLESNTASVLLRRNPGPIAVVDDRIRPLVGAPPDSESPSESESDSDEEAARRAVRALHDIAFPGTHTTPAALVASTHPRSVIEVDGAVVGYVAFEMQSDGSGYIDYLAVDEAQQGQGFGGALVDYACKQMFEAGAAYAHLTVREDNAAARALYARLGFIEERLARPFRRGFSLD